MSAVAGEKKRVHREHISASLGFDPKQKVEVELLGDGSAIVKNVKLNSNYSKNGSLYPDPMLKEATPLYEGAKVFNDHTDCEDGWMGYGPRKREAIMGDVINVRFPNEGGGHRAEFRILPSWVKKGLAEDIKSNPKLFGFSHVVWCEVADKPTDTGQEVITKIHSVESVDLVSTPATTRGMFESVKRGNRNETTEKETDMDAALSQKLVESLEGKVKEKDTAIIAITGERDTARAESAGLKATLEQTKVALQAALDRANKAEGEVKTSKVEAALAGLGEGVQKALREATKPLALDVALAVIEQTKAAAGVTSGAALPKPEADPKDGAGTKTAESKKKEAISDDAFLSAIGANG